LSWHTQIIILKEYVMKAMEITLAERGQIVIPKEARDALGLRPGARLQLRVQDGRVLIEKLVRLDLSRWVGKADDDGLTTAQALTELRGRPVPWQEEALLPKPAIKKTQPSAPKSAKSVKT
jgi:AbrB family looped-hinge helix DNA binding protein